ncbi:MAG: phosphoribosyl-AMP cyclohydrolase [Erythrobacter sp.]|nr:phosphoribosyl-AMP cyclohydrolase [Erythrobacter sp.]
MADGSPKPQGVHLKERCKHKPLCGTGRQLPAHCGDLATNAYGDCTLLCGNERIGTISSHDHEREAGSTFMPRFDGQGLLGAVVQHAETGEVLMFAFIDAEALQATRDTGEAHFHSRSRGRLWKKGETSGNVLKVQSVLVDCDQDALVLKVLPIGPACHTGARSCFYRRLDGDGLVRLEKGA